MRIHTKLEDVNDMMNKLEGADSDLTYWEKYSKIVISDNKCALFFAKTGKDFWELHLAFDEKYRGKKALNIIKQGIQWMLDNKTSRIVCGIPSDKLNIRMLANNVGFQKLGKEIINSTEYQCYEIRR
jgi:hypothetical protein